MTSAASPRDRLKRAAATYAADEVEDGMVVGLGSGSTAAFAVEALAARTSRGLRISAIPTSETTRALALRLGIPLTSFAEHRRIDMTIDGADQVERGTLDLVKGLGGALLREKIVASASRQMVVIVDETKLVDRLGSATPLPVEIVSFGWETVLDRLVAIGCPGRLRLRDGVPFVTDAGNHIADCNIPTGVSVQEMDARLSAIVGVVETGLFTGLATKVVIGRAGGIEVMVKSKR